MNPIRTYKFIGLTFNIYEKHFEIKRTIIPLLWTNTRMFSYRSIAALNCDKSGKITIMLNSGDKFVYRLGIFANSLVQELSQYL